MKERWQKLQSSRWFMVLTNKFVMATLAFIVWMLFLDINSYLIHNELNTEIDELEQSIDYYQIEIASDEMKLEELTTDDKKLEKFAREEYWMHRKGERIFLIEQDDHE